MTGTTSGVDEIAIEALVAQLVLGVSRLAMGIGDLGDDTPVIVESVSLVAASAISSLGAVSVA